MARIKLNVDLIYPIGSIYMSVNSTNPSTYFGGTWVAWGSGRVPVGVKSSDSNFNIVEKTGGEKTHTLTIDEIPSHNHYPLSTKKTQILAFQTNGFEAPVTNASGNDSLKTYTGSTGGGQSHNNLQPYITCYMWKRTA